MATLTREQLLGGKRPMEVVTIEELGGDVFVATMASPDKDAFERGQVEMGQVGGEYSFMDNIRARFLVRCLVDESGQRLLADDDMIALGQAWNPSLEHAFDVAKRLNGMSPKDLEDMAKNSETGLKDSSGTT